MSGMYNAPLSPTCDTIPCVLMRAGTSRGPFFLADWLPAEETRRNRLLLAVMGSPHSLQLDGLGGANSLTSKVAIVSRSRKPGCDVDYLFAQVAVEQPLVDTHPNCGNMLAGGAPFAIEQGLVKASEDGISQVKIHNVNTGSVVQALVHTPNGKVVYAGDAAMDGVAGLAAPITLNFLDAWGKTTGTLFPDQGQTQSRIDDIRVTLIDAGIPMMQIAAADVGLRGDESADAINRNHALLARIDAMRLQAGRRMGLGDVTDKVIPKPALLSQPAPASHDADQVTVQIQSRYLTPHSCHRSHAVTGAIGVATAALTPGTLAHEIVGKRHDAARQTHDTVKHKTVGIAHPSGQVRIAVQCDAQDRIQSMGVVRTVRKIMQGQFFLPPEFL